MLACSAGGVKSRTGTKRLTLIIAQGRVAAPVRLFFEQEKIVLAQKISGAQTADATADDHTVVALRNGRLGERVSVANLMADLVMIAIEFGDRGIFGGEERKIHGTSRSDRTCHNTLQKVSSSVAHECSPSREEGSKTAAAGDSPACCVRVRSLYQIRIVPMENKRIRVEMALISGVIPRRRRDHISSGNVLSRPMRKKVTAISSRDSVKIKRAAAISETCRFGKVIRQKVLQ